MKTFIGLIIVTLYAFVLYGALCLKINGALNFLQFWIWTWLIITMLTLGEKSLKVSINTRQASLIVTYAYTALQCVTLCALIWSGHTVTAVALLVSLFLFILRKRRIAEFRKTHA